MTVRIPAVACLASGLVLAMPALAEAKTKTVNLGMPPSAQQDLQKTGPVDVNDYFPHTVTVNVGDKVRFRPVGFHSVDFPARGQDPLPLLSPAGEKVAGVNDAAGQPFWFNGLDNLGFTPELTEPAFGKKLKHTGNKRIESGLPLQAKPKPMTVRFKKTGRWTYYCNLHPGMTGVVSVKGKRRSVPSRKADKRALARQVARSLKTAKALGKTTPPANTIDVGVAGRHGEEWFDFVPKKVTVPVGTTLNFRMGPGSYEIHTATAGPGDAERQPKSYLGEIAASFGGSPVFDPRGVYASEAPGSAAATLTPSLHGNGFWNSGALDTAAGTPLPASNSVTFGAPGTYDFYCLIHPFMKGTVTVQ